MALAPPFGGATFSEMGGLSGAPSPHAVFSTKMGSKNYFQHKKALFPKTKGINSHTNPSILDITTYYSELRTYTNTFAFFY